MIAVSEQRCGHGFLRSIVGCRICDTNEALKAAAVRAKPLDKPSADWQPVTLALPPPKAATPASFAFSIAVPGVPYHPPTGPTPSAHAAVAGAPEFVLQTVADAYFVSVAQLCSKDRHQSIAQARLVAYWALRRLCNLSYPQIGRALAGRDHTTAMAGVRKVEAKRDRDARFRRHTDEILVAAMGGVAL